MNWRKHLPVLDYTLSATLPAREICERLADSFTDKPSMWPSLFEIDGDQFYGEVWDNGFVIWRVKAGRNSFIPAVTGQIILSAQETKINVSMRLRSFTRIFMTIWLSLAALGSLGAFISLFYAMFSSALNARLFPLIIPIVMFAFGYAMMMSSFQSECWKARKFLAELLEAEEDLK